jgi:dolichyl-phosphate-mannose-protein mannosyltransferase
MELGDLRRGINFSVKDHRHIYLVGNPFTLWMSTVNIATYALRGLLHLPTKTRVHHSAMVKYDQMVGIPRDGMGTLLSPVLLHGLPIVLTPLFPGVLVRDLAARRGARSRHLHSVP